MKLFGHYQLQQQFLTPSLGLAPLGSSRRLTPVLLLMVNHCSPITATKYRSR
jgi:hypothetical protein